MRYSLAALLAIPALLSAQTPDAPTLAGLRWRSIGPVNMAGRITDVEVDPRNPKVFYIAGATGGIWKTINAGTTWIPLWERQPIASLGDLAISPSNRSEERRVGKEGRSRWAPDQ